jgi:hypothetical protein
LKKIFDSDVVAIIAINDNNLQLEYLIYQKMGKITICLKIINKELYLRFILKTNPFKNALK